ncbi:MAG: hypothetical protein HOP29_02745, partial [Phycisphaerales bacterium]|nr:hypothetical protein [Phycisphaerales bacterium]
MGETSHDWSRLRERLTGKWQVPLLAVSLVGLAAALLTYKSPTDKIPFDERRDALAGLIDKGQYTAAMESASVLLQIPEKSARQMAPVHLAMARARVLRAEKNDVRVASVGEAALEHFTLATEGELVLTPADTVLLAKAYEWAGDREVAIDHYERAAAAMERPEIDLRWHLAKLHGRRDGGTEGRRDEGEERDRGTEGRRDG